MKLFATLTLILPTVVFAASGPKGIDVSSYQLSFSWDKVKSNGVQFTYIKATEGTSTWYPYKLVLNFPEEAHCMCYTGYRNPAFNLQYAGATKAGIIRGSYHFARPDISSGAAQANYFVAHGGGWSADGITLPGALDIEYNPDGSRCYGLSRSAMVAWIKDFSSTYHSKTGRYPVIYTTADYWKTCTGNSSGFENDNPLWIARWGSSIGDLPASYKYTTFWQYAESGPSGPGDQNIFNGDAAGLKRFAKGS